MFIAAVLLSVVAIIALWWWNTRKRAEEARAWPLTNATVTSGALEPFAVDEVQVKLPVFAFDYCVGNERFSGRFTLRPYLTDPGEGILDRMVSRTLRVHYNPSRPSDWLIAEEFIEGCKVEQPLALQVFPFSPKQ